MALLFAVCLSGVTIARLSHACAYRFTGFADAVQALIAAAAVKHLDETGFRIASKTCWLHIACTRLLTCCRVAARGSMREGFAGIVVHDHWKPYDTLSGVLHALCNARHLRKLKALVEIEHEAWAANMQRLLRHACHATKLARGHGTPLEPALLGLINRRHDAIIASGIAFHQAQPPSATASKHRRSPAPLRIGHNLLLRLLTPKRDLLRFLSDPSVPFSNNEAERDGRTMERGGTSPAASAAAPARPTSPSSAPCSRPPKNRAGTSPIPSAQARPLSSPASHSLKSIKLRRLPCSLAP